MAPVNNLFPFADVLKAINRDLPLGYHRFDLEVKDFLQILRQIDFEDNEKELGRPQLDPIKEFYLVEGVVSLLDGAGYVELHRIVDSFQPLLDSGRDFDRLLEFNQLAILVGHTEDLAKVLANVAGRPRAHASCHALPEQPSVLRSPHLSRLIRNGCDTGSGRLGTNLSSVIIVDDHQLVYAFEHLKEILFQGRDVFKHANNLDNLLVRQEVESWEALPLRLQILD